MNPWHSALREGAFTGSVASILSTAALLIAGRVQNPRSAAPVNATSHWLWGDRALRKDAPSWRYTATGYLIHHGASVMWATLHARALGAASRHRTPAVLAASATTAASVACLVDMKLTPHRLTPGFEHRLSRPALALVYGCFALGLAVASSRQRPRR